MFNYASKEPSARSALYCTESFEKSQGNEAFFEIHELNIEHENVPGVHRPAGHKRHTIIWIKEGCGQLFVDLQRSDFHDNVVFYLEPGQFYRFRPEKEVKGYIITFSAYFLDMSEIFICLSGTTTCSHPGFFRTTNCGVTTSKDLQNLVHEMMSECANRYLLGTEVLRGLIGVFMVHLARNCNTNKNHSGTNHDEQFAKKFMELLNENVYARKTVSDYANDLAISANYLNQVIKRYTGFTASYHIQQYTILEAKRRALYFGNTMKETAYHLGFDDLAHFSKFFKKNAGTSFRDFKNKMTGSVLC